VRYDTYRGR